MARIVELMQKPCKENVVMRKSDSRYSGVHAAQRVIAAERVRHSSFYHI